MINGTTSRNFDPAGMYGFPTTISDLVTITAGSGAPTFQAPQGSLYLRTDGSSTSTRAYINTDGNTTWTAVTTAS